MERDDAFVERAFSAAGPVFLVAMGVLMLLVLAFVVLFVPITSALSWGLLVLGAGMLTAGVLWGAAKNRSSARRET